EDGEHHLGKKPDPRRDKSEKRKRRGPSTKEKRGAKTGDGEHGQIFAEKEERKFETRIFGVITGDQLRLAFRQIEGRAISLCRRRDGVHHKSGQPPGRKDVPVRKDTRVSVL